MRCESSPSNHITKVGVQMKKFSFVFTVAILLCIAATALAAEDFTIPSIQDAEGRSEVFRSIVVSDAVYMLSGRGNLYILDVEAQTAMHVPIRNANPEYEQIPEAVMRLNGIQHEASVPESLRKDASGIDNLFWDGKTLYGVNALHGALYRVTVQDGEATLHAISRLDFSVDPSEERFTYIHSGVACNGSLYLMMDLIADDTEASFYRFDMTTGARETFNGEGMIEEIASYLENHLLILETDGAQWQILDYDTEAGSRFPLYDSGKMGISNQGSYGLLYDPWRDQVLIQSDEKILAFTDEKSYEVVTYLQPNMWSYCRSILPDGRALLASKYIYARSVLEERPVQRRLQIACGSLDSSITTNYAEAYPDIVISHRLVSGERAVNLFAEHINIQSDEIAIFELPVGEATKSALRKGYYYALNASPSISNKIAGYRSFFQQAVMNENDIGAIPTVVEQNTLAYSRYALEQLGLTAEDMPSTYGELFDFLLAWDERIGDAAELAEITPFEISNHQLKVELFVILMNQYYALLEKEPTAAPTYETDMAALLDKLTFVCDIIPQGNRADPMLEETSRIRSYKKYRVNDEPSYLFTLNGSFHPGRRHYSQNFESVSDFVPINLAVSEQEQLLLFQGSVFIVNPYSSQKEEAIHFLSYYMEHFPPVEEAAFDPDAVPLESKNYKDLKTILGGEIKKLEIRAQAAEGAEKRDLEVQLQSLRDDLQSTERIKWDITKQTLDEYEQALRQSDAVWVDPTIHADAFNQTYRQYLSEGLDGSVVAKEFFHIYLMLLMESR